MFHHISATEENLVHVNYDLIWNFAKDTHNKFKCEQHTFGVNIKITKWYYKNSIIFGVRKKYFQLKSFCVAVDRTEKSQRQFNIAPQQFIVPQTKRHNYHGSWKLWSWAVGKKLLYNIILIIIWVIQVERLPQLCKKKICIRQFLHES